MADDNIGGTTVDFVLQTIGVGETKTWADVVRVSKTWSGHRPSSVKAVLTSTIENAIATN